MPIGGVIIGANLNEPEKFVGKLNNSTLAWKTLADNGTFMDAVAVSETVMDAVAASETAMNAVATSEIAMDIVAASETAMNAITASEIAMNVVAASETARDAIWNSEVAWNAVKVSNMAIGKYVTGAAGLNPENYADMDAVVASETAMNAVGVNKEARGAIWNSELAWDKVKVSKMAVGKYVAGAAGLNPEDYADIDAITASETAMNAVWNSEEARNALWDSGVARVSMWNSGVARVSMWEWYGTHWDETTRNEFRQYMVETHWINDAADELTQRKYAGTQLKTDFDNNLLSNAIDAPITTQTTGYTNAKFGAWQSRYNSSYGWTLYELINGSWVSAVPLKSGTTSDYFLLVPDISSGNNIKSVWNGSNATCGGVKYA